MSIHEAEFQMGDRVIHNLSGLEAEVTGFTNNGKVIIKLDASGRSMTVGEEDLSPAAESDASVDDMESYDDDDDDDDAHSDHEEFYVAVYDEHRQQSWIGFVTKRNGTKWHEKPFKGTPDHRWGSSYMSYLSPEEVMQWIRKDYSRGYDIAGPFDTDGEAEQYVSDNFGGMEMNESGWLKQGIGTKRDSRLDETRSASVKAETGWLREGLTMGAALKRELSKPEPGSKLDLKIKKHNADVKAGGKGLFDTPPEGYKFKKDKTLVLEGAVTTVKKAIKSIKRGMSGWDKEAVGVAGEKTADPKEIVKRNKAYDDATVLRLAKETDFEFPFGKDAKIGAKTPRGLQRKVLDREIKKRGLGEGYVVKNGSKFMRGSPAGGAPLSWTTDKSKATVFKNKKDIPKSVTMRGWQIVLAEEAKQFVADHFGGEIMESTGWTKLKESQTDELLQFLRKGYEDSISGQAVALEGKQLITRMFNSMRDDLMREDMRAFMQTYEYYSARNPDAFDHFMDSVLTAANVQTIDELLRLSAIAEGYVVKNGSKFMRGSPAGGGPLSWTTDKSKATVFKNKKDIPKSVTMRGWQIVLAEEAASNIEHAMNMNEAVGSKKVHLKTAKFGLADHPGRDSGVSLAAFSKTDEADRCPKCNSLYKNHYAKTTAIKEAKQFTDFEDWKQAVLLSYPAQAKKIKFKGRLEGKKHTVSAEVPGEDRSYGVWDMDAENGVVLSEGSSPFKPNAKVKIVGGPADVRGQIGYIGEIKTDAAGNRTFVVDLSDGGAKATKSVSLKANEIRLFKESVTVEEGWLKAAFAKKHS